MMSALFLGSFLFFKKSTMGGEVGDTSSLNSSKFEKGEIEREREKTHTFRSISSIVPVSGHVAGGRQFSITGGASPGISQ